MKILVGTLYSGENDFEACVQSIKEQSHRKWDHFVIEHLPKREAHECLYKQFMDSEGEFDLFLKIDADMVLCSNMLFSKIVDEFQAYSELLNLQIAVHDYFTDGLIGGLHSFRNTVQWSSKPGKLFTDYVEIEKSRAKYDAKRLAPAALHCHHASPAQAFHFGLHRGLKAVSPDAGSECPELWSTRNWEYVNRLRSVCLKKEERRRWLALVGAELAFTGRFTHRDQDYTSPVFQDLFSHYGALGIAQLRTEYARLSRRNYGWLGNRLRRKLIKRRFMRRVLRRGDS